MKLIFMYVTTYSITFFLSELPISTFFGNQFYQKQVRKRNKYNKSILRISEHICGRKWWLSVRQYRDQRHQKCFTRPVGPSLRPLSSTRSDQPSKKVSSKIVKWLQSRTALCDLTRKIVRNYTCAQNSSNHKVQ